MLTKGELPYFLCGFDIKPEASEAILRRLDKGVLIDVPAGKGYRNQPTFSRDGILEAGPIEAGKTRTDSIPTEPDGLLSTGAPSAGTY